MTACHATERFADTGTHVCFVCCSEPYTDMIRWAKSRIYFSANIPGQRKYHQSRINTVIHCSWKITKTYRTSPRSRYLSNINEIFIHEIFFPPTPEENNKWFVCFFPTIFTSHLFALARCHLVLSRLCIISLLELEGLRASAHSFMNNASVSPGTNIDPATSRLVGGEREHFQKQLGMVLFQSVALILWLNTKHLVYLLHAEMMSVSLLHIEDIITNNTVTYDKYLEPVLSAVYQTPSVQSVSSGSAASPPAAFSSSSISCSLISLYVLPAKDINRVWMVIVLPVTAV